MTAGSAKFDAEAPIFVVEAEEEQSEQASTDLSATQEAAPESPVDAPAVDGEAPAEPIA